MIKNGKWIATPCGLINLSLFEKIVIKFDRDEVKFNVTAIGKNAVGGISAIVLHSAETKDEADDFIRWVAVKVGALRYSSPNDFIKGPSPISRAARGVPNRPKPTTSTF